MSGSGVSTDDPEHRPPDAEESLHSGTGWLRGVDDKTSTRWVFFVNRTYGQNRSGSTRAYNVRGVDHSGDIPQERQHDIEPELQTDADLQEYAQRREQDRKQKA